MASQIKGKNATDSMGKRSRLVTKSENTQLKINSPATNSGTVLIVDDTPDNLLVLFSYLEEKGYKVLLAESGESALEIARSQIPDLILLDILMPEVNGFETCRQLKAQASTKEIPVIFLTALSETINKVQGFKLGGVDYITKPLEQEEVLARIQTHIALRQLRQRIIEQNHELQRELVERRRVEASLRESERRWRTSLENLHLMVVELESNGRIEYVNPYFLEMTGYTNEEILGQDWFQIISSPNQKSHIWELFQETLQQKHHSHYQESIITKSGSQKIIAWNNTLLKDAEGKSIGIMSIGKDITEQYLLQRMKDEFISIVSHELRTPLTLIQGMTDLLSQGSLDLQSPQGQQIIHIANNKTEHLVQLVNNIAQLEHLTSGKFKLSKQQINVAKILAHVTELMQPTANKKNLCLIIPERVDLKIDGDEELIVRVLINLLNNAIAFSQVDGKIWLSAKQQDVKENDSAVLFTVRDRGHGIAQEKLNQIFAPFYQLDGTDSRSQEGTGIGLAICRHIVELHGGQIWAESVLGKGSSFHFTLPIK